MDKVGGAQKHVEALSIQLKQDGHEVTVVTGTYQPSLWRLHEQQVPVISIPSLQRAIHLAKDFLAFWQLRSVFKRIQPDVVAAHSSKAGIIGRVIGSLLGIPTVFTAHSWSFTEGVPQKNKVLYHRMEKSIQLFTTKIITVSEYDRELALMKEVAPAHKLLTIHNGIDPIEKRSTTERIFFEQPVIVMVARFEVPKRQDILLNALAELTHISWHLQLIGDGSQRPDLEKLVEQSKLTSRVTFLGNQLDVHSYLEKSHIFVLLSDWEGLPISIIEAMRVGLPIIATNVGGVKELVADDDNGFLVEREDFEILKQRLYQLIMDANLRQRMGNASECRYLQYFTFTPMYQKTITVYQQAVSELAKKGD